MMNYLKNKFIFVLSSITLFLGILTLIISYCFINNINIGEWANYLRAFEPLDLRATRDYSKLWETITYFLLFFGIIFYLKTNGKEKRLLGFVFSIVLIDNIGMIISAVFSFLYFKSAPESALVFKPNTSIVIVSLLARVFYIIISFLVLKKIKQENEKPREVAVEKPKYTDKWQRFFHVLIDSFIIVLVFANLVSYFSYFFKNNQFFQSYFNNYFGLMVIVVLIRLIFYPVFEFCFGASPAKFLTQSKVVDKNGNQPKFNSIFKRSLYRSIPFDSLSFLGKNGWHDSLSETYVVKEEAEGVKPKQFLWILTFIIPFVAYNFYIKDFINKYRSSKISEKRNNYESLWYENSKKNINTNQIYVIRAYDYTPNNKNVRDLGLKIEEINENYLKVKEIKLMNTSSDDFVGAKVSYYQQKDTASVYEISREKLESLIPKSVEQKYKNPMQVDIFDNDTKYIFKNVYEVNVPNLSSKGIGLWLLEQESKINPGKFILENLGKSGKIISIKNIEGDKIEWKDNFPVAFSYAAGYNREKISLKTNYKVGMKNTSEIIVVDSLNHQQKYILEIDEYNYNTYRIK